MDNLQLSFLHTLVVSASFGALIGLIRQWADMHDSDDPYKSDAGIRTYSLWSLLGFLSAYVHEIHASYFFPVAFGIFGIFVIAAFVSDKGKEHQGLGLTSSASALLTWITGSLIYWQQIQAAFAIAVCIGILIASKPIIHRWTKNLTNEDIISLLQFLAVTGLVLPLVPNKGFGPLEAFNPYNIWLMVVLISGLGFVGYIAVRLLGTSAGITVTGLAGGLASSTATTLALTRNSRDTAEASETLAIGIVIANTVMLGRVTMIILALNQPLFMHLLVPVIIMALPTCLYLAYHFFDERHKGQQVDLPELSNPLSLKLAIKFALLYGLIVFLIKAVTEFGGGAGFYPIAFLSGLTDMDAIALSLTNENSNANLATNMAATGIIIGAIANSIFKTGLGVFLGDKKLRKPLLFGMIPMILAGFGALAYLILL